jgi:hypothetical protein
MTHVADAIRKVTAIAQQRYDDGERSAMIDLHDLLELLLAIADELEIPDDNRPGCEFCRAESNRPPGEFDCPYCQARWPLGVAGESDLLTAARALLEAREDQMVTSAEWDRLRQAIQSAG